MWSENNPCLQITHADVVEREVVVCKMWGQEQRGVFVSAVSDGQTETGKTVVNSALMWRFGFNLYCGLLYIEVLTAEDSSRMCEQEERTAFMHCLETDIRLVFKIQC